MSSWQDTSWQEDLVRALADEPEKGELEQPMQDLVGLSWRLHDELRKLPWDKMDQDAIARYQQLSHSGSTRETAAGNLTLAGDIRFNAIAFESLAEELFLLKKITLTEWRRAREMARDVIEYVHSADVVVAERFGPSEMARKRAMNSGRAGRPRANPTRDEWLASMTTATRVAGPPTGNGGLNDARWWAAVKDALPKNWEPPYKVLKEHLPQGDREHTALDYGEANNALFRSLDEAGLKRMIRNSKLSIKDLQQAASTVRG